MRSNALLLAVSLFSTGSVLAGPCKPRDSTSGEASISYGTTTATILKSTTFPLSETTISYGTITATILEITTLSLSKTIISSNTTTTTSSDTITITGSDIPMTISSNITTIIGSDAPTTISSDAITTTLVPMDTTALSSDAESSTTVATTTTAPASLETFALIGAGGSVTNAEAQGSDEAGSLIVFNPTFNGLETRHYTLDTTTGRLQDAKSGNYVCAYYGGVYTTSVPPYVATCDPASTGPDRVYKYLDCRISGRKLSCRTPSTALCYYDGDSREYICMSEPQNEPYHEFFYQNGGDSDYWYISNGSPDGYTAMDILVSST